MDIKTLPNHIAIIPDGNRRWAKSHNMPAFEGHRRGADVAIKLARYLRKIGVHTLTLWVFSTENKSRDKEEVDNLMKLFDRYFDKLIKESLDDNVRFVHLGRKDRIPKSLLSKITELEEKTKDFTQNTLNIALDYGGNDEMVRAIKKIENSELRVEKLNEDNFPEFLDTAGQPYPNPDLVIRTSGEMRTSGLMPWQTAYSEYVFLEKFFPDLSEEDLDQAIENYANRQRRFGK